jgi:hypothetical protein
VGRLQIILIITLSTYIRNPYILQPLEGMGKRTKATDKGTGQLTNRSNLLPC